MGLEPTTQNCILASIAFIRRKPITKWCRGTCWRHTTRRQHVPAHCGFSSSLTMVMVKTIATCLLISSHVARRLRMCQHPLTTSLRNPSQFFHKLHESCVVQVSLAVTVMASQYGNHIVKRRADSGLKCPRGERREQQQSKHQEG